MLGKRKTNTARKPEKLTKEQTIKVIGMIASVLSVMTCAGKPAGLPVG